MKTTSAALAIAAAAGLAAAAIAQNGTYPEPPMGNDMAMNTMSPGNDVMATPASPDSSMSKGSPGRKHMPTSHTPPTSESMSRGATPGTVAPPQ